MNGGAPTTVEITRVQTGKRIAAGGGFTGDLAPGTYTVKVQQGGDTVASKDVTLLPGRQSTLDLSTMRLPNVVSSALIGALPAAARAGDFTWLSQSLGEPIASRNPALLLSLAAASRIVANPATFWNFGPLPLATFDNLAAGQSAVYVVTGRDNANAPSQSRSAPAPGTRSRPPVISRRSATTGK